MEIPVTSPLGFLSTWSLTITDVGTVHTKNYSYKKVIMRKVSMKHLKRNRKQKSKHVVKIMFSQECIQRRHGLLITAYHSLMAEKAIFHWYYAVTNQTVLLYSVWRK